MGCKMLWLNVALLSYLMICEHVRAQCTQPSFASRNAIVTESYLSTPSFPDGSNVTVECETGFKPVNSRASKSVTCQGNQWTTLALNCTKKSCGSLPDFHNGRYEMYGILFGDKITAVCNKGYMLVTQPKDRWCRDQGWDGRDPVCEVVTCGAPPAIVNGQLEEEPQESYNYLQAVFYRCNSGLSLIGSSSLHCSENGTFTPDPPICIDGCPKPEVPNASRIGGRPPPYKLSNFIDYECDTGYTMKGKKSIKCTENGWNPEPPKCIGPCSEPVFGGYVTLTEEFRKQSFPYGSKVTFECIRGYEPVDSTVSKSVTCEENNWTELLFTCKVVTCLAPPAIVNGQLEKEPRDSYNYLNTVSYKCNSGFSLIGSSSLHCSADGTFSPDPPKCDRSDTSSVSLKWLYGFLGLSAVLAAGGGVYAYKKHRSKHEYSGNVAKNEEGL